MPQVPYEPYTTAQPQGGGESFGVNTPGAAFGENIGAALQNLGSTTQKAGDELFNRAIALQQLRNEADARDAQSDYATKASLLHADFASKRGKEAADALPKFIEDQRQLRESIGARLTAPMARKAYDADSLPFMQRNIFSGASHAGEQNKDFVVGNAQAAADNTKKAWVDAKSESEYDTKVDTINSTAATLAGAKGWGQPQIDAYVLKEKSDLRKMQIAEIAKTDPGFAYDVLAKAEKKGEITQQDHLAVSGILRTQNRAIAGDILADTIYKQGGSLEEMEAKAREQAPALAHGDDTEFTRHVINGIRSNNMIEHQAMLQQRHSDEQTVLDYIHAKNPTTEREVLTDPETAAAYHAAQAHGSFKHGLQSLIDANVNDQRNQQNDNNYNALRGMALRDRAGFLNTTAQDLHSIQMSKDQRNDILQLRKQLIAEPINDPRVSQSLRALRQTHDSEMRDLGVFKEPAKDADSSVIQNYDRFLGSLSGALDEWSAANPGRPRPTPEEFDKDIAKPLLRTHKEPWMWFFNKDVGSFNEAIPKDTLDKARDSMKVDAEAMGMPTDFTDREIIREVQRQQWKQLYAKEKVSGGPTPPKP